MHRPKTKDITAKFIDLLRADHAQGSTKENIRKPGKNLKGAFITISGHRDLNATFDFLGIVSIISRGSSWVSSMAYRASVMVFCFFSLITFKSDFKAPRFQHWYCLLPSRWLDVIFRLHQKDFKLESQQKLK